MKAHDEVRLSTLRMLSSALSYEKIAKQHELNDEEEVAIIRKESKKRIDAIEGLKSSMGKGSFSTPEEIAKRLETEQKELEILKEYLPLQMDDTELSNIITDAIAETGATEMKDMGRVIALVKSKAGSRAEGSRIADLVKQKLTSA